MKANAQSANKSKCRLTMACTGLNCRWRESQHCLAKNPCFLVLCRDITESKQAERKIQLLAHFDPLTGLPNRVLFTDRCNLALRAAQRNGTPLALMFLDLDHFKNVNDSLGHRVGDELLIALAGRLKGAVREQDTVSRLGGDEFILVLPETDARVQRRSPKNCWHRQWWPLRLNRMN